MQTVNWTKFLVVGAVAGTSIGGTQFVQTDAIDIVQLVVGVLTALLAFLTDSKK